ncbi:MAG TPA: hypothetical protein DDZ88_27630, partial [Verrucomicrobiales bacterium]|nr:hypothetical protein [Verrucomicrobiales bacterium]
MRLHCLPIPTRLGFSIFIKHRLRLAVVGQHSVAALDVLEGAQDRLGRGALAVDFEVPLQVADPQHEFGDGGGTRIELDAEKLVGIDGVGLQLQLHVLAKLRGEVEHLAFEDFHLLEGDVEEIAAAAG